MSAGRRSPRGAIERFRDALQDPFTTDASRFPKVPDRDWNGAFPFRQKALDARDAVEPGSGTRQGTAQGSDEPIRRRMVPGGRIELPTKGL
jgi:hypothetical protein